MLALALLAPFCYAAFFTFPDADDYGRAVLASHLFDLFGGIKEMLRAWMKWSGRYTHHFMIVFFGDLATTRAGYTAACLANMAIHYLALAGIGKELSGRTHKATAAFFGLFPLFALAATHGSLQSSWYLLTGILSLGAASGFTLLYIWALCVVWNRPVLHLRHKVFSCLFCIAAIGCYEHSAVITVIASTTAYIMARTYNHRHLPFFKRLFIISCVCIILSFFCRGNFRRQDKRDVSGAVIAGQMANAWGDWLRYVAPKLVTPLYLSVLAWGAWVTGSAREALETKISPKWIVLYCLTAAAGYMGSLTVIHAASDVPVGEADNIPAHMSIFCAVIFAFCLAACPRVFCLRFLRRIPKFLLLLLCLAPLLLTWNTQTIIWNETSGALEQYAATRNKRDAYLRGLQGADAIVAPLDIRPFPVGPIFVPSLPDDRDPVMPDPKAWPTKYVAQLHNLASLRSEAQQANYAFARIKRLPSRTALPGVFASYTRDLQVGANETYRSDWLMLAVPPETLAAHPRLHVAVVSEGSFLDRVMERWPEQSANLAGEDALRRPDWLRASLASRWYDLNRPNLRVTASHPDRQSVLFCLPVNASGLKAASVYISLDEVTYAKVSLPR